MITTKHFPATLLPVTLAAFLLTACSPSEPPGSPDQTQSAPAATPSQTDAGAEGSDDDSIAGPLDARLAVDRALQLVPGAVVELGRERERGVDVWEVGVLREDSTGTELYLAVDTGEKVRESTLRLSSEQRTPPAVTAREAIDVALGAVPGSIVELDLGTERGAVVWEALVSADAGGRFEVYIDAASGAIVKQERDD